MIKLLLTGFWVCLVTLGAVYFSVMMATAPQEAAADGKSNLELVSGELVSIPVLSETGVSGYFFSRVAIMADKDLAARMQLPVKQAVTDELFSLLVGNEIVDPSHFDLDVFRQQLRDGLNRRFGENVVAEVLVEQLDYLSNEQIRNRGENTVRRPVKLAEPAGG